MISASLSLSLPRLGWKSTSMPRSLKICTAAGDSASEMRTLGFVIWAFLKTRIGVGRLNRLPVQGKASEARYSPSPRSYGERVGGSLNGEDSRREPLTRRYAPTSPRKNGERLKRKTYAALASDDFISAK